MSNDLFTSARRRAYPLAVLLGLAGCSTPTQVGSVRARPAHVSVVNLTDYSWRVDLAAADGSRHLTAQLEPRRSAELDVPGGAYQIDQSILNATDRPNPPRHFAAELIAGKTYHWPLATLQSDADEDRAEPHPRG